MKSNYYAKHSKHCHLSPNVRGKIARDLVAHRNHIRETYVDEIGYTRSQRFLLIGSYFNGQLDGAYRFRQAMLRELNY